MDCLTYSRYLRFFFLLSFICMFPFSPVAYSNPEYLLMQQPNYEDPLNHEAADVLRDDPKLFESNVRKAIDGRQWVGTDYFSGCN